MTTLLQRIAEQPPPSEDVHPGRPSPWKKIAKRIVWGRLNGEPVMVRVDGVTLHDKTIHAERFVFSDDIPAVMDEFEQQGMIQWKEMLKTLHHPAAVYWVEWVNRCLGKEPIKMGCLVDTIVQRHNLDCPVTLTFCAGMEARADTFALMIVPDFPVVFPRYIKVPWLSLGDCDGEPRSKEDIDYCTSLFYDFMYVLFAIITPRVSEVVMVEHSPKLQKARTRNRKFPLIEYKRCHLQIGHAGTRYATRSDVARQPGETEAEHHKRLHQVIGHFRTYTKGREQPRISWVPPHWRGDAKLGILVHERTVSKHVSLPPLPPQE